MSMPSKNQLQLTIYVSALLLAMGVFLPLTSLPVAGDVSYYRIARVESWLVVVFALLAPALILGGKTRWAVLAPVGVWAVLLFPAIRSTFESANDTALSRLGNQVTSAMVDFSADLFLNIADFEWGGLVFILALFFFTLSGIIYRFKQ
jgi:CBS-domain-containing membrane protein